MNIPGTRDTSALNAYKLALWECQQERDKFGEVVSLLKARNYELLDRDVKFRIQRDKLLEVARFYLDELVYNDYVPRDFREIVELKKLISECAGEA